MPIIEYTLNDVWLILVVEKVTNKSIPRDVILIVLHFSLNPELMEAVKQSYTPSPGVELFDTVYDVRSWLDAASSELHNITNPHCFVLKETSNGDVVLKYKNWLSDKAWKPSGVTDKGVVIAEVSHH